jgi:hypothetical protein
MFIGSRSQERTAARKKTCCDRANALVGAALVTRPSVHGFDASGAGLAI